MGMDIRDRLVRGGDPVGRTAGSSLAARGASAKLPVRPALPNGRTAGGEAGK